MNDLIKIAPSEIDGNQVQTVDARGLHKFLESGQDFSTWIKGRIENYEFVQDVDFIKFHNSVEQVSGAKKRIEYHLSIDMAKELSMVERNEKGKQARTYFIDCERKAKAIATDPMAALNDPAIMRGLLLTYSEKNIALEAKVDEQAPKVAGFNIISDADGSFCITDVAKAIQVRPKDLFQMLSTSRWVYRRAGGGGPWISYQHQMQRGTMTQKVTTVELSDGSRRATEQARVTPKGLAELSNSNMVRNARGY